MELTLAGDRLARRPGHAVSEVSSHGIQALRESFAAYVAHELRTPLATQRALLELALADPSTDAAAWRAIGQDVLRACRQQERLLEACLTLARSGAGLQRCELLDLAAIVTEALRAHDLGRLERVVAVEQARTSGDPSLVERLVANSRLERDPPQLR